MSNELPYMPTFIGDFMAAVAGWPPDRVGAYWLALMYQWENGGLPADDARELSAILHTSSRSIARRLWSEIAPKFHKRADGRWWNAKAEAVRIEARRQFATASQRGKKGANARWGKGANAQSNAQAYAQALPEHCLSNANQNQNQVQPPKPPASGGRRRRRRVSAADLRDQEQADRTREVKRLMQVEGLSRTEAAKRAGYQ